MVAARSTPIVQTRSRRAKRARADVADPQNWRDWANLTDGPAALIAEEVLADDVAGYLRFRSVCRSWRRCTPSPDAHDSLDDSRFHPRRWIMLPEVFAGRISRRDFLNVSTGERIQADLPKLRHHFVIGPTSEGLILLCRKRTGEVRLLNPLTKQLTTLPDVTSLLSSPGSPYCRWKSSTRLRKLKKLQAFNAGLADSSLALHFNDELDLELAVAKPNAERWSRRMRSNPITAPQESIITAMSFGNRFYCLTRKGIKVVDAAHAGQPLQLVAVEVDEDFRWQSGYANLVDIDGELLLLRPSMRRISEAYEVHRIDLDAGEMVPMRGLRGGAVFLCDSGAGRGRSLSVNARLFPSIKANAIYRCRSDRYGKVEGRPGIDVFLVPDDQWMKYNLLASPGSIIDYLSRYVCRSRDIVVPAPLWRCVKAADDPWKTKKRKRKANPKVIGNEWVN